MVRSISVRPVSSHDKDGALRKQKISVVYYSWASNIAILGGEM